MLKACKQAGKEARKLQVNDIDLTAEYVRNMVDFMFEQHSSDAMSRAKTQVKALASIAVSFGYAENFGDEDGNHLAIAKNMISLANSLLIHGKEVLV